MARPGLYANIYAKRKRGGKMRKKGAKGAPTAANFARGTHFGYLRLASFFCFDLPHFEKEPSFFLLPMSTHF